MVDALKENAKQELEVTLGGKMFTVRPDFTVLTNIEAATNQSARILGMRCLTAALPVADRSPALPEISVSELALIMFCMLKGKPDAPKTSVEVGNTLVEDGYGQHLQSVGLFLVRGFRGNKEHEKEATQASASAGP